MNDFERYVNDYAKGRSITIEEAMTHQMVKDYKNYYDNKDEVETKINEELEVEFDLETK